MCFLFMIGTQECPACGQMSHRDAASCRVCGEKFLCEPVNPHPDNPTFANPKPYCFECGGNHEPSGARSDCIAYWKQLATLAVEHVEWARALLCSATPSSKVLDSKQQVDWANGFGTWFAQSHSFPALLNELGCARFITEWLQEGTYRSVIHRHTGTYRAVDEAEGKSISADTFPLLADALQNWKTEAEPIVKSPPLRP